MAKARVDDYTAKFLGECQYRSKRIKAISKIPDGSRKNNYSAAQSYGYQP
jgi:hypothetical protein